MRHHYHKRKKNFYDRVVAWCEKFGKREEYQSSPDQIAYLLSIQVEFKTALAMSRSEADDYIHEHILAKKMIQNIKDHSPY